MTLDCLALRRHPEPGSSLLVSGHARVSDDLHWTPADTMRRMLTVSADANALIAQIIAVIVFASVVELRKAFRAQTTWELKALVGVMFLLGGALSGGLLVSRIADAAGDGATFESGLPLEIWIALQFMWPLLTLLTAEAMKIAGHQISGKKGAGSPEMTWALLELRDAMRRNAGRSL